MKWSTGKINPFLVKPSLTDVRVANFDLDLDPMTLILTLDPDIVKMYHHTKDQVSMSTHSKVIA